MKNQLNANSPSAARTLRQIGSVAAATTASAAFAQNQAKRVEDLLAGIRSTNEAVSTAACDSAAEYGPGAIRALAFEIGGPDFETARKAKRALYKMVRQAGRPGAEAEAAALQSRLVAVLHNRTPAPLAARREIIWLLSEIGGPGAVTPLAQLLGDKDLREDARCALTRLPSPQAVTALKAAFSKGEENFKYALADSLRNRGEQVAGYPSRKMVPVAQTTVVEKK